MQLFKTAINLILLLSTPSLFTYPYTPPAHTKVTKVNWLSDWWYGPQRTTQEWIRPSTYDEILCLLDELDSGELETKYSPEQLEQINEYIATLALEGILPNEDQELLQEETYDLMYGEDSAHELVRYLNDSQDHMILPAVLHSQLGYNVIQCGKISNSWKKTKKFVKNHKKEIIIGAVVVVAVTVVTVAVVVASSATAATAAAGAAGAAASLAEAPENAKSFQTAMEEQMSTFKETISTEDLFKPVEQGEGLSLEETGRTLGPLFAHESFNTLVNDPNIAQELRNSAHNLNFSYPPGAMDNPHTYGHQEIDHHFSSDCGWLFSDPNKTTNINALSYQLHGDKAFDMGHYQQAVNDFSKSIEYDPNNPLLYLKRSGSYFDMGQYDQSFEDFNQYIDKIERQPGSRPFSMGEFTRGFARGIPDGVYESGKGMLLFFGDVVVHPIRTATQMYEALTTLARLAKEEGWGTIGEALAPEIHQLVTQWDTLTSERRGELAGYALGKYGADIAAPGAIAKVASSSAKGARELVTVLKNLQAAEGTILIETAASVGNAAKVGEIINTGKTNAFLGEELGFTAKEMGQLKQSGTMEKTLAETYEHLTLPKQESFNLFKKAQDFLILHPEYMTEARARELISQTGIPTFPRPKGIPENYRVRLTETGAGMVYVHPRHTHTSVRVMPGKAHSRWPKQQRPYVIQKKDGKAFDKYGNLVGHKTEEAHIPLEEFIYRE